jgi:hypothetical protein
MAPSAMNTAGRVAMKARMVTMAYVFWGPRVLAHGALVKVFLVTTFLRAAACASGQQGNRGGP